MSPLRTSVRAVLERRVVVVVDSVVLLEAVHVDLCAERGSEEEHDHPRRWVYSRLRAPERLVPELDLCVPPLAHPERRPVLLERHRAQARRGAHPARNVGLDGVVRLGPENGRQWPRGGAAVRDRREVALPDGADGVVLREVQVATREPLCPVPIEHLHVPPRPHVLLEPSRRRIICAEDHVGAVDAGPAAAALEHAARADHRASEWCPRARRLQTPRHRARLREALWVAVLAAVSGAPGGRVGAQALVDDAALQRRGCARH
mmetsp:Transcript_36360/g.90710  ORF Transcript_36360/g.90710 Transcript_36360/m.90710 type:complete len:262 (-) Transcript_36360:462-1247(-)